MGDSERRIDEHLSTLHTLHTAGTLLLCMEAVGALCSCLSLPGSLFLSLSTWLSVPVSL